jgi:L-Ala-D/L-Glu epimerase
MNRRDWLKLSATASLAATSSIPSALFSSETTVTTKSSSVNVELKRLNLQHTWTTTMSSSTYRETVNVRYDRAGLTGYG